MAKYDRIGTTYDSTRKADPVLTSNLLRLLDPQEGKVYLDIGCGTGNYTNAVAGNRFQFIGVDPSQLMLDKAAKRNDQIIWKQGRVENIPLDDNSVDGIMGSLTIHHWSDLNQGFQQLFRVIKPGCRIVLFAFTPEQVAGYWLNHYFPKMLDASLNQMPYLHEIQDAMISAGFKSSGTEKFFIHPDIQDKFLYSGKENPALYLDETIRSGISSFSDLAYEEEVTHGLEKLAADISSGAIHDVMDSYQNDLGDYIYILGSS